MPLDTEVPALLLRLDPNPYHHGTLGAVRSLGRAGVEVHLAQTTAGPVDRSRYIDRLHRVDGHRRPGPPPPYGTGDGTPHEDVGGEGLERELCRVSDAVGRRAVLIALDDAGAIAVAALSERLRDRFLLPGTDPGLPARVADKAQLAALCRESGVAHPATVAPDGPGDAAREAVRLGLPAVAKWSRPWLLPKGLRSTSLVHTPDAARRLYEHGAPSGAGLLLQQRLPGGRGTDWFFHGYADGRGGFLAGGAGRKERSWPPRTGPTAVGVWLSAPDVERAAARVTAHTGYRGVLDLDFRLDPATGAHHLLDFNPRPGAQFRLFTDEGGLDVVRAQHLHLTGRPLPPRCARPGRIFVAENYALLSALAAPSWAGLRGRGVGRPDVERAWFAADDPLPFLAMSGSWPLGAVRKTWRRTRGKPGGRPGTSPGRRPGSAPAPAPQ